MCGKQRRNILTGPRSTWIDTYKGSVTYIPGIVMFLITLVCNALIMRKTREGLLTYTSPLGR